MRVRDVMTPSPVSCTPKDTLYRVAALMLAYDCTVIPVCEDGKVVGIVTERDVVCVAPWLDSSGRLSPPPRSQSTVPQPPRP